MLGAAGLHHQLDPGLADREADALADVVDVDQVAAALADRGQQGRQRPGLVGDLGEDPQPPAAPRLVVAGDVGEDAGVDVAAGEDHHRGARRGRLRPALPERRDADRAGTLDHQLRPLEQQHDRVGDRVLVDRHHLVHQPLEQWPGDLARMLHRDPVGEGAVRAGSRPPRPPRCCALIAVAIPEASPPPPTGTSTLERSGDLLEQLEPDRPLPGDHRRVVERVDEGEALGLGVVAGVLDAVLDRLALQNDLGA